MTPPVFLVLANDPAVAAWLGSSPVRLFQAGEAPEGVGYPYATWQVTDGAPENYLADSPDMDLWGLQIDVWSRLGSEGEKIAMAISDALTGHAYVTSWRGQTKDSQTGSYRFSFDVDWHAQR